MTRAKWCSLLFLLFWSLSIRAAVNLNTASVDALQGLKGIGPAKAAAIVHYREVHGPFVSIDALRKVPGFGDKTVERLKPDLVLHGPE